MTWILLSTLSALALSAENILSKGVLRKENPALFAALVAVMSAVVVVPFVWIVDWSKLTLLITGWLVLCTLVTATAFTFATRSMKHLELSVYSPMFTLTPAIVAVMAGILLGEFLHARQLWGIGLIMVGGYALQLKPGQGWLYPVQRIWHSEALHYLLIALLLYPLGTIMARYTFLRLGITPYEYLVIIRLMAGTLFAGYLWWAFGGLRVLTREIPRHKGILFWTTMLGMVEGATLSLALSMAYVAPVLAVKRLSSLFTTVIGGELFHEENLARKTIACIVMLVGAAMVAFL